MAETLARLGELYQATGPPEKAAPLLARASDIARKAREGLPTLDARVQCATVLLLAGHTAEARPIAERVLATGYRRAPFLELLRRHGFPVAPGRRDPRRPGT